MHTTNRKPRICLVAHNAFGALTGIPTGHIGGIERQQSSMARWLSRQGYEVSMVTWDEGQEQDVYAGVRIITTCKRNAGLRGVRFFHPRWTSLHQALRIADADIYHYNCGDLGLGQVVLWCQRHGKASIHSVANDPDCDPQLPHLKPLREKLLYRYGLRHANCITVQTHSQQKRLEEGFGISSQVVGTPNDSSLHPQNERCQKSGTSHTSHTFLDEPDEPLRVLWAGRFVEQKRFDWLLDIAERCPHLTFDVVGGANSDSGYASALMQRAQTLSNVVLHGKVPYVQMASFYQQADILFGTSRYEGFPNVFIEGWSYGLPVVSSFDPDDVISTYGLGSVAKDLDGLATALCRVAACPADRQRFSIAAQNYYGENLTIDAVMTRFESLFLKLTSEEQCHKLHTSQLNTAAQH